MAKKKTKQEQTKEPQEAGFIRRTLWHVFIGLQWTMVLALFGAGAYDIYHFLFTSEFFIVRHIEIEGCRQTSEAEMLQLAGIPEHVNIFSLNTERIAERIEKHPWTRQVQISRVFPDRIRIAIRERKPVAALNSPYDGKIYGIDSDGVVLPEPEPSGNPTLKGIAGVHSATGTFPTPQAGFNLPVLTGLSPEKIFPGNRLEDSRWVRAMEIIELLKSLNQDLLSELSEIHLDAEENIVLYPMQQVDAIYLGGENLPMRTWRLARVWNFFEEHGWNSRYIDCRFDQQGVVTRPVQLTQADWEALPDAMKNLTIPRTDEGGALP
jgi:hypothetical protein